MKPMLAGKVEDISTLQYPLIASPKLDGIRCLIVDGKPVSRKLKEIPNRHVFNTLKNMNLPALDGELMLKGNHPFNEISSAIMSEDGKPDFVYVVFDIWNMPEIAYVNRLVQLMNCVHKIPYGPRDCVVDVVSSVGVENVEQLLEHEKVCLEAGYEGVMVRTTDSPYKYGRSTTSQGYLLKLKRFEDSEAVIIGAVEEMHNGNAAEVDNLGRTKRSAHKANLTGKGVLGAFKLRNTQGVEFEVGTGFTAEQRALYWKGIDLLIGKTVVYKHQASGALDKPRFPVFKGFRHTDDV